MKIQMFKAFLAGMLANTFGRTAMGTHHKQPKRPNTKPNTGDKARMAMAQAKRDRKAAKRIGLN